MNVVTCLTVPVKKGVRCEVSPINQMPCSWYTLTLISLAKNYPSLHPKELKVVVPASLISQCARLVVMKKLWLCVSVARRV